MSVIAVILEFLDIFTTWYITSHGGVEMNPLAKLLTINGFLIFKIATLIGMTIFIILARKEKINIEKYAFAVSVVLFIAVLNNTVQIILNGPIGGI